MHGIHSVGDVNLDDLIRLVARANNVRPGEIVPFGDYFEFLAELFTMTCRPTAHVISAGHCTPEVEMAADRAEVKPAEVFGVSPFATEVEAVLHTVRSTSDIIYVANPNRVSGNNFSVRDLAALARAVPRGFLIVDEYYFEYYGITAIPLLSQFANVIVLRSFTGSFGIMSIDAGYVVATPAAIEQIQQGIQHHRISTTVRKTILAALMNRDAMSVRLKEVHAESLRVCQELMRLGVQTRLTATDFILIRVADPRSVGNTLARHKVLIDNLDGYRELNNFMRYRIQSPLTNDKLVDAFKSMPKDDYYMTAGDRRASVVRHAGEESPVSVETEISDSRGVLERRAVYTVLKNRKETAEAPAK